MAWQTKLRPAVMAGRSGVRGRPVVAELPLTLKAVGAGLVPAAVGPDWVQFAPHPLVTFWVPGNAKARLR